MSFRKRIPAVAVGAALALSPVVVNVAPAAAITAEEQAFVDAINAARIAAGLPPLTVSEELTVLAERHSYDMGTSGTLAHTTDLAGTIGSVYPNWTHIGENVGYGSTVEQINSAFFNSPTHAANIYGDYNLIGVGIYTNPGGVMWVTELFAKAVVDTASTSTTTSSTATAPTTTTETPTLTVTGATAPTTDTAVLSAASSGNGGAGHGDHVAKAKHVKASHSSGGAGAASTMSAMGAARGAFGTPRSGPPEWAQNDEHGH